MAAIFKNIVTGRYFWELTTNLMILYKRYIEYIVFLQTEQVVIDIILTENEEGILDVLLKKWQQHNYLTKKMTDIIKRYGLSNANTSQLERKLGVERVQVNGDNYTAILNDCVEETKNMQDRQCRFGTHEYSI